MSDSGLDQVRRILLESAEHFGKMVGKCWPSRSWECSEANLTLHLGRVLLADPHRSVFLEPQFARGSQRHHIDLVAWDHRAQWELFVETKALWGSDKARSLANDAKRLRTRHVESYFLERPHRWSRYGALLCATENPRIASWWQDPDRVDGMRSKNWDELRNQMKHAHRDRRTYHCENRTGTWDVDVLCAVFPLQDQQMPRGHRRSAGVPRTQ